MSLLGTFLRPKHLSSATKVTSCSPSTRKASLHSGHATEPSSSARDHVNNVHRHARRRKRQEVQSVEDVFIRALVQASSCGKCSTSPRSHASTRLIVTSAIPVFGKHHATIVPHTRSFTTRSFTTRSLPKQAATEARESQEDVTITKERRRKCAAIPREGYQDLANTYDTPSEFWQKLMRSPVRRALPGKAPPNHIPLAPRLVLTAEQESRPPYSTRYILPPEDEEHANQLQHLKRLLQKGASYKDFRTRSWKVYRSLRSPRPRYLTDSQMRQLLRNLSWVEFKTLQHCRRYFSVLDECILEGVELTAGEWNTAIAFAGRWVKYTSTDEVKMAVEAWMRMENNGVEADNVTFNILFDVAVRAGRFALADTIYEELKARDLPLNRYFLTSMIHYAGLRRDGDAVRQAFRQFVNSGEIVDTAVMNCVILSLLRAGEAASAWSVFQKMKELHAAKFGIRSPANWAERKLEGKRLHLTAQELRKEKEAHEASFFGSMYSTEAKKEEAQRTAPIHPDKRTCEILLKHHSLISGNFDAVTILLKELDEGGWNVHGSTYFHLFGGFHRHGGVPGSSWKLAKLETFWQNFLSVLRPPPPPVSDEEADDDKTHYSPFREADRSHPRDAKGEQGNEEWDVDDAEPSNEDLAPYFTPQLTITILNAFYTCAGMKRALEVWQQILEKWPQITPYEQARLRDVVEKFKKEDDMYVK